MVLGVTFGGGERWQFAGRIDDVAYYADLSCLSKTTLELRMLIQQWELNLIFIVSRNVLTMFARRSVFCSKFLCTAFFFSKLKNFLMIWKIIIQNTCMPWQWWFDSLRKHTYAHLCHSSWGRRKRGRLAASFSCAPNVLPLSGMMIMVHMMGDKLLHPLFFCKMMT